MRPSKEGARRRSPPTSAPTPERAARPTRDERRRPPVLHDLTVVAVGPRPPPIQPAWDRIDDNTVQWRDDGQDDREKPPPDFILQEGSNPLLAVRRETPALAAPTGGAPGPPPPPPPPLAAVHDTRRNVETMHARLAAPFPEGAIKEAESVLATLPHPAPTVEFPADLQRARMAGSRTVGVGQGGAMGVFAALKSMPTTQLSMKERIAAMNSAGALPPDVAEGRERWAHADAATRKLAAAEKAPSPVEIIKFLRETNATLTGNENPWRTPSDSRAGGLLPPEHVSEETEKFAKWLSEAPPEQNPLMLATEAHLRLNIIHPFKEGNGRTCQMLMDYVLMRRGLPPAALGDKTIPFVSTDPETKISTEQLTRDKGSALALVLKAVQTSANLLNRNTSTSSEERKTQK